MSNKYMCMYMHVYTVHQWFKFKGQYDLQIQVHVHVSTGRYYFICVILLLSPLIYIVHNVCSLYGVKLTSRNWDVVTVNFSNVFERLCNDNDFYLWQPWDARTESDCILGLDVTLERRLPSRCCLIGPNYVRTVSTRICQCSIDDYEW